MGRRIDVHVSTLVLPCLFFQALALDLYVDSTLNNSDVASCGSSWEAACNSVDTALDLLDSYYNLSLLASDVMIYVPSGTHLMCSAVLNLTQTPYDGFTVTLQGDASGESILSCSSGTFTTPGLEIISSSSLQKSVVLISSLSFLQYRRVRFGPALSVTAPSTELYLDSVRFHNCSTNTVKLSTNTVAAFNGGAVSIFSVDTLEVTNSVFTNNSALSGFGSALWIASSATSKEVLIYNSTFDGNLIFGGGALGTGNNITLVLQSSKFRWNSSPNNNFPSGTVYLSSFCNVTAIDSLFAWNNIGYGPSIFANDNSLTIGKLIRCSINYNVVFLGGLYMPDVEIYDSEFIGNTGRFGLAYAGLLQFKAYNTLFKSNIATSAGGIAYHLSQKVIYSNCTFEGNRAPRAGALYMLSGVTATITDCTFTSNVATTRMGGSINAQDSTLTLTNVKVSSASAVLDGGFIDCQAISSVCSVNATGLFVNGSTAGNYGGALKVDGFLALKDSSFLNARASWAGGAVYFIAKRDASFDNVNFVGSSSLSNGGAVSITRVDSTFSTSKVTFTSCSFSSGLASGFGGAVSDTRINPISTTQYTTSYTDCTFSGNSATSLAGALYLLNLDDVSISNSEFFNNSVGSDGYGGAVFISAKEGSGITALSKSTFDSNVAAQGGGCLYHLNGQLSIENSSFTSCSSSESGGAVEVDNNILIVKDSVFSGNLASNFHGGAIMARTPGCNISNSEFHQNSAKYFGGAIALFAVEEQSPLVLSHCTFEQGTASNGGALYIQGSSQSMIMDSTISSNEAFGFGGGVAIESEGSIDFSNCKFEDNTAGLNGGGVYVSSPDLVVSFVSSEFLENFGLEGGALAVEGVSTNAVTLNFEDATIARNSANIGGGIFAQKFSINRARSLKLLDNKATATQNSISCEALSGLSGRGGGAYFRDSSCSMDVSEIEIIGNEAELSGGGILFEEIGECSEVFSTEGVASLNENTAAGFGASFASSPRSIKVNALDSSIQADVKISSIEEKVSVTPGDSIGISIELLDGFLSRASGNVEDIRVEAAVLNSEADVEIVNGAAVFVNGIASLVFQLRLRSGDSILPQTLTLEFSTIPSTSTLQLQMDIQECTQYKTLFQTDSGSFICQENYEFPAATQSALFTISALALAVLLLTAIYLFSIKAESASVKRSSFVLSEIMIFGLALIALSLFLQIPANESPLCHSSYFLNETGLMIVLGSFIVRSFRFDRIFNNPDLKTVKITDVQLMAPLSAIAMLPLLVNIVWASGVGSMTVLSSDQKICESEHYVEYSATFLSIKLACVFAMIYLAYRCRNIPFHFNDSQIVAITAGNVLVVSVLQFILEVSRDFSFVVVSRGLIYGTWIYLIFSIFVVSMVPIFLGFRQEKSSAIYSWKTSQSSKGVAPSEGSKEGSSTERSSATVKSMMKEHSAKVEAAKDKLLLKWKRRQAVEEEIFGYIAHSMKAGW